MRRVLLLFLALLFALSGCAYRGGSGGGGYGDDDDSTEVGDDDDSTEVESGPMDLVLTITNDTGETLTYLEQFFWEVGTDISDGSSSVLDGLTLAPGETFTDAGSFDGDYIYGLEYTWAIFAAEDTWTRCYVGSDVLLTGPSSSVSIWLDLDGVAECPE